MREVDITVANVSKRYAVPQSPRVGSGLLADSLFSRRQALWALKDINFEVFRQEALGIVGHNGAGKSTLVKLLSGITVPTRGEVTIRGTLSAMVEVGAGFNIELTGRENVFLAGSILGMSRGEIARKLGGILEFAGIADRIDAPVKTYSSGEYVRLGFSIAAQLDHDIFLLDEVLAVGDVAFQARCLDRIDRLRHAGKTIVLVSHDLAAIERVCDRAILLNRGELFMTGSPRDVVEEYSRTAYANLPLSKEAGGAAELAEIHFERPGGGTTRTGDPMAAHASFRVNASVSDPIVTISLYWPSGYLCTQLTSAGIRGRGQGAHDGLISYVFKCPTLTMQRGLYRVDVSMEQGGVTIGHWPLCSLLRVDPGKIVAGDFYLEHSVSVGSHGSIEDQTTEHGPQ